MSKNIDEVIFAVLFLIIVGYGKTEETVQLTLWRNLCASMVFLIFVNRNLSYFSTEVLLERIQKGRLQWFFSFVINSVKVFFASVCFFAIPLYYFGNNSAMSVFAFVSYCVISALSIVIFIQLNFLIANKYSVILAPNRMILLLTFLPIALSIAASILGLEKVSMLFVCNVNAYYFPIFSWEILLPIPYFLAQLYFSGVLVEK